MFSFLIFTGKGVLCNQITQTPSALTAEIGNQAKIFCNYATTYSNPDLYWYRQLSDHTLQFILHRDNSRSRDADFAKGRFAVERDLAGKTFHLVISPVGSEDAASYYCAIRTTMTQPDCSAVQKLPERPFLCSTSPTPSHFNGRYAPKCL
uniref:Ig-like domain-containing protein n=1 Tax=Terrapene triunguis TaxID=2587831 RepID=A0A674IAH0_9SAUR